MINRKLLENREDMFLCSHKAMNTIFEIVIQTDDKNYAQQASWEAIKELELLELQMSKFIPNSEISKINSLKKNESVRISEDVFNCLIEAYQLFDLTDGAFDISIGEWIDKYKINKTDIDKNPSKLILSPEEFTVSLDSDFINLDLGGIGKGYAIDRMMEILLDWEIENAFIHGGGSSVKSIGNFENFEGWPISISNPNSAELLAERSLINNAFSSSGIQKGEHIIDPRTGKPALSVTASWIIADKASTADALTTAALILNYNELEILSKQEMISFLAILVNNEFKIIKA